MITAIAPGFQYSLAVTPSDSAGFIRGANYIKNTGTSGALVIRQDAGDATITEYLKQGDWTVVGQHWVGINSTGLGAGVTILAYY